MHQEHKCQFLPKSGVNIIYTDELLDNEEPTWHLLIAREATEDDLESNHYLEMLGEIIWQTIIEINNCPFCGQTLSETKKASPKSNFVHFDFGRWNMIQS